VTERKKKKPVRVANVVADLLAQRGLRDRVEQAAIIPEWARLVGAQIGFRQRHSLRRRDHERMDE